MKNNTELDTITADHQQKLKALQDEVAATSKRSEDIKAELHRRDTAEGVQAFVSNAGPWASKSAQAAAAKLLHQNLKLSPDGQKWQVIDEDGGMIIGASGPMTPVELIKRFRLENSHFVRQAFETADQKPAAESDSNLKRLFGSGSDSKSANDLAIKNIDEYRRLKAIAKARGIL